MRIDEEVVLRFETLELSGIFVILLLCLFKSFLRLKGKHPADLTKDIT